VVESCDLAVIKGKIFTHLTEGLRIDRQTERQKDGLLVAITRPHSYSAVRTDSKSERAKTEPVRRQVALL